MQNPKQENSRIGNLIMLVFSVGAVIALNITTDLPSLAIIAISALVGIVARFVAFLIVPSPNVKE